MLSERRARIRRRRMESFFEDAAIAGGAFFIVLIGLLFVGVAMLHGR